MPSFSQPALPKLQGDIIWKIMLTAFRRMSKQLLSFWSADWPRNQASLAPDWLKVVTILFLLLVGVFIVIARLKYRSDFLFGWDSAGYALAMEQYLPRLHQPHPPGNLLYVLLLKGVNLVVGDPNSSLISVNIMATVLAAVLMFLAVFQLLKSMQYLTRYLAALGATVIFATDASVWLSGSIGEIYALEAFLVSLMMWLLMLGQSSNRIMLLASFILGLVGGIRPTTEAFILPFYLLVLLAGNRRTILLGVVVLVFSNLSWLLPSAILAGGPGEYWRLLFGQAKRIGTVRDRLSSAGSSTYTTVLLRVVRTATLPMLLAALLGIRSTWRHRDMLILVGFLIAPLLTFLFVSFPKEGYLLIISPAIIVLTLGMAARSWWKHPLVLGSLVLIACWWNVCIFTRPKIYALPELVHSSCKRMRTEFEQPNKLMISGYNTLFKAFTQSVSGLMGEGRVFICVTGSVPDAHCLMYYYPRDKVIYILPNKKSALVAFGHKIIPEKAPVQIGKTDRIMIVVSDQKPELRFYSIELPDRKCWYASPLTLPRNFRIFSFPFRRSKKS